VLTIIACYIDIRFSVLDLIFDSFRYVGRRSKVTNGRSCRCFKFKGIFLLNILLVFITDDRRRICFLSY
jgi:hypothetical protein